MSCKISKEIKDLLRKKTLSTFKKMSKKKN